MGPAGGKAFSTRYVNLMTVSSILSLNDEEPSISSHYPSLYSFVMT